MKDEGGEDKSFRFWVSNLVETFVEYKRIRYGGQNEIL